MVVALTGGGGVVEPSAVQRFDLADLAPANGDAVFAAVERMLTFLVAACSKNGRSIVHLAKERRSQEVQLSVERADPDPAVLEYLSKVPAFGVA